MVPRRHAPRDPAGEATYAVRAGVAHSTSAVHGERVSTRTAVWTTAAATAATAALVGCSATGDTARQARPSSTPEGTLVLATTTSTQDSGLLDTLVPDYEAGSRCRVKTVAVGSGEALALGADGNADVLLVHSPAAEQQYMAQGHGLTRAAVMHNDFVLLGPSNDPAHAARAGDTAKAFAAIAAAHAPFASRADESGTNAKELTLWARAGVKTTGGWYLRTGQGMGETLTIASQKQAYTLSDRGTYLATRNLDLRIVSEGQQELFNPYHVIVVRHAGTNVGCARQFDQWIVSGPTQQEIGRFGVKRYGQRLFVPDARP
jgi:tungstate transport system substrate-binding protein